MVRIQGNSPERVKINDLNDVIYYRQKKEYTDQEFESSRDLKKEIKKGRITVIEKDPSIGIIGDGSQLFDNSGIKGIMTDSPSDRVKPSVDLDDIKKLLLEVALTQGVKSITPQEIKNMMLEVLAGQKTETKAPDMSNINLQMMIQGLLPMIADTVRQEVAKIPAGASEKKPSTLFSGPTYVPNVSTVGMTSNIQNMEGQKVSSNDTESALAALKNMNRNNKII